MKMKWVISALVSILVLIYAATLFLFPQVGECHTTVYGEGTSVVTLVRECR